MQHFVVLGIISDFQWNHAILEYYDTYYASPMNEVLNKDLQMLSQSCCSDSAVCFPQIEACSKEAEKIDSLINYASPTLVSHVPLSAFLTSEIKTSTIQSSAGSPPSPLPPGLCFLLGFLIASVFQF